MKRAAARGENGMVLLNVLIVVALASTIVAVMIFAREQVTARTLRFAEASQAQALAHGGELTVISALRRDTRVAPGTDHWHEAWVRQVVQKETAVDGGRFALSVTDGQARFNLNNLASGSAAQLALWRIIAGQAGLDVQTAERVRVFIQTKGRLEGLRQLQALGIGPHVITQLDATTTLLPSSSASINLNTAPEPLVTLLLSESAKAEGLLRLRRQRGFLLREDFQAIGVTLPAETGFATDFVQVSTSVRVGDARQTLESLLERRDGDVVVVRRLRAP